MTDEGQIFIVDIQLSQQTEVFTNLYGRQGIGQNQNIVRMTIQGTRTAIHEVMKLLSSRPSSLISTQANYDARINHNQQSVDIELMGIHRYTLALFNFNEIRADNVRNDVDEFRKIVRGCTARLSCKLCKQLTVLYKAMTLDGNTTKEEADELFFPIHKG